MLNKAAVTEKLKDCRSVASIRSLQRERFGDEIEMLWLDLLDDACMFGAAGVLGMIQHGVPVQQLQMEIIEMLAEAIKAGNAVH